MIEPQVTIPQAHTVIAPDGAIADQSIADSVRTLAQALVAAMQAAG